MPRKNKKKIVFVEPRGTDDNVFAKALGLPLMGPVYLATILKKKGYDVKAINENLLGRDVNSSDLHADILCVTILTLTANRGYEIARRFKLQNPMGKVIIGGIHATMMPEEAIKFADHVVMGEGEKVIVDLIEGKLTDKIIQTGHVTLDDYPAPDFSVLENSHKMPLTPFITSRGCPFDCTFCSVTEMFGKKYRTVSINNTMKALKKMDPKKVFFYDDNFAAIKSRTYELVKRIKRSNLDFKWTAQVRTDVTNDPKLIEKMADAGCYNVYVGFESINPKTLKSFNKAQGLRHIKQSIKVFHDNSIDIHGMFIFGSDDDDKNVFRQTSQFCNDYGIDSTQFAILTPMPGTVVYKDFERTGRLVHKVWDYYDGLHAVFQPRKMTPLELQEGMVDAFQDFYSYTRAVNDAFNTFVEYNAHAIRSIYSQVTPPSFSSVKFKLMGTVIVRKWIKQNQDYINFLSSLDLKKIASQHLANLQKTA
ncbi:B12-binding domain-containing radical SAM protein [Nanoarchaeota archaeon]